MIQDELVYQILQDFGFEPTQDQRNALHIFARFMTDRSENAAMILRGSAGTGKTSLAGAIVRAVNRLRIKVSLLAPTGRAAKVFSLNAGLAASTIHRKIYREKAFNGADGQFQLNNNMFRDMLFMVDEASMISLSQSNTTFGSGRLLDDLVQYVYSSGANCRLLLIGDKAQLPPVGEQESPALRADVLKAYGLQVYECDLDEVLRQSQHSGILWNATAIREMITYNTATQLPQIHLKGFADISIVQGNELIESLASSYSAVGMDETMVITRSNKRANIFNQGIRNTILGREEELTTGDLVMVVKNKYLEKDRSTDISFIANGDHAVVRRVRNIRELYGFRFADVALEFPDYNNTELDTVVVLDTLTTEAPALTHEQNDKLFQSVMEDYADVPRKADRMKQLREDEYFNAMQIKFGYAVTCHKAQGGQWAHIYLDQGYMTDEMLTPDYIHWLYTAFTRATEHLYLVNWSQKQTAE
ncbi:ATP-dependent endonuclease [Prevotella intermedia ATCC 25611 = DSM 20706]|uniref:ATP-dependent endonuclease n=1 Tax=Prevotella intermedia TaxID=28131 RepID=A0A1P8JJW8_PREIN|nr:AAA family ATPase [Prevotella intermedia]AFJ09137.1 AAA domain protein [Prevotella intermedia 17]APW32566.1 ATP-dependent endonuclease [Prevotella intermedia ATCC 25611 = DSM 20706]APW34047.1 ATP-dependent endonuclease [Prevotella intermedia]PJF00348.1 ATP-dependent endonuclease [Prevotella intermedia]SUB95566.1 exonuclease V subunit alpha [Prevotella intermedia]